MKEKYTVSVSWTMLGSYEIEAESKDQAIEKAQAIGELPEDQEYLDDSFSIDHVERSEAIDLYGIPKA